MHVQLAVPLLYSSDSLTQHRSERFESCQVTRDWTCSWEAALSMNAALDQCAPSSWIGNECLVPYHIPSSELMIRSLALLCLPCCVSVQRSTESLSRPQRTQWKHRTKRAMKCAVFYDTLSSTCGRHLALALALNPHVTLTQTLMLNLSLTLNLTLTLTLSVTLTLTLTLSLSLSLTLTLSLSLTLPLTLTLSLSLPSW